MVLKALAKNPDNRYQTAAEMRTDLVRVHNGEAPEAPKVLTDADRSSMMSATATRGARRHRRDSPARAVRMTDGGGRSIAALADGRWRYWQS